MTETLLLSQGKLQTFLTCARRFQLRYLQQLPWPAAPVDARSETAVSRGQQFHLLMEQHFLGLTVPPGSVGDPAVSAWFHTFKQHNPVRQNGRFLPEHRLTVPVGRHLLLGRFDLLVVGEAADEPFAHVYDWKTGRVRGEGALRQEWQTRLYLAMLAEGGGALLGNGRSLPSEAVSLTYWYVTEPESPRHIGYSQRAHAQNWAEIQALVAQIEARLPEAVWPLTEDWNPCRRCAYQVFCGRQEAGRDALDPDEEPLVVDEPDSWLEPDLP